MKHPFKGFPGGPALLWVVMVMILGCTATTPRQSETRADPESMNFQEPNLQKAVDMTPASAADEAKQDFCAEGSGHPACSLLERYSKGAFPGIPEGSTVTVGRSTVAKEGRRLLENRFLVAWFHRSDDGRLLVRFFDPNPADEKENHDIEAAVKALETKKPMPENSFSRYLNRVTPNLKLFPAVVMESSLTFKGSETFRVNRKQRQVVYFVREAEDRFIVLYTLIERDLSTAWGIAELPKPVLR